MNKKDYSNEWKCVYEYIIINKMADLWKWRIAYKSIPSIIKKVKKFSYFLTKIIYIIVATKTKHKNNNETYLF